MPARILTLSTLLTVAFFSCRTVVAAAPNLDGVVLWLDASDAATLVRDARGHVRNWKDKSAAAHDAVQDAVGHQPRFCSLPDSGKPGVAFDGGDFLSLGQSPALDFGPHDPFTVAVVYHVARDACGTFLAKGGGETRHRAYQFYAAPGKLGAIAHGSTRHEASAEPGQQIAVLVCDGTQANVFLAGESRFSFAPASGSSTADVLVGARRGTADNTGISYPLTGQLAEVLVYRRALGGKELGQLHEYLFRKHAPADLDALAKEDALAAAERLWRLSQVGRLSERQTAIAATLLTHDAPFVRGLAEWAIATKVGADNNGEEPVWPKDDAPEWFKAWTALSPKARLEADYVRQAALLGIHHDARGLLASAEDAVRRAEQVAVEIRNAGPSREPMSATEQRLNRLASLRDKLAKHVASHPDDLRTQRGLWLELRHTARPIVLANPAVQFERIIFTTRFAAHTSRNITRSFPWKHKPGGDICVLSDFAGVPEVRRLIGGQLGPGYVWGLDLGWNGDRAVFSYAKQPDWPPPLSTIAGDTSHPLRLMQEPLHIYEIRTDGTGLRQLTDDPQFSDFEPTYCANGEIVFASDRCRRSAECGSFINDIPNPNLYIMSPDGAHVRRLTDNKDLDRYPHSLENGLIAYTHWEYQERHFMEVHAIWTVRPDGTMSDTLFKHHMPAPCGLRDTRSVPGSSRLVSIATGHHTFAHGPVVLVDPRWGLNDVRGLWIVTPGVVPQEGAMAGQPVPQGGVPDRGGLYRTPWALSETCFLVGYAYPRAGGTAKDRNARADSNGFGLYLIDVYGNKELLWRDPVLCSSFPIPLTPRTRPPVLPSVREETPGEAVCYVTDVYDGMEGVPRGAIKYLRVSQHVGWPLDAERGKMPYLPNNAWQRQFGHWSWSPVRVIGTVPVEQDGSAHIKVPADTAVYFQALDENYMELRRMRSMVSLQHGEVRGCRGCHETQSQTPVVFAAVPRALEKPPQTPQPPPWGAERMLGYEWLIQPILDRHCVRCHGRQEPDGGLNFTATRADDGFLQSFRTMFGKLPGVTGPGRVLVSCSDRFSNSSVTRPMQFGSHKSPLVRVLLDDELHRNEVDLNHDEWLALVTWVDANAPYYDRFFNKRPPDGKPIRNITPDLAIPFAMSDE
jgi:hypothetical protein